MLAQAEETAVGGYEYDDPSVADADDEYERVKQEFAKAQAEYQETLKKQEEQERLQQEQALQQQQQQQQQSMKFPQLFLTCVGSWGQPPSSPAKSVSTRGLAVGNRSGSSKLTRYTN